MTQKFLEELGNANFRLQSHDNILESLQKINDQELVLSSYHAQSDEERFLLGDLYISTLSVIDKTSKIPVDTYGGFDVDEKVAKAKAISEFVERDAFFNKTLGAPVLECPNDLGIPVDLDLEKFAAQFNSDFRSLLLSEEFRSSCTFGVDLTNRKTTLVSTGLIYNFGRSLPIVSSSGFAAHTSLRASVEAATLELIERDAFMRFWLHPETAVSIDDDALNDLQKLTSYLSSSLGAAKFEGRLLLLPSPLNIPVVLAIITSNDPETPPAILCGAKASFDLTRACAGAVNELRSATLNFIAKLGSGQNLAEEMKPSAVKTPKDHFYFYHNPQLLPKLKFLPHLLGLPFKKIKQDWCSSFDELLACLRKSKESLVALDVTPQATKELGLHVVRCLMSSLMPMQFGYPLIFDLSSASDLSCAKELPHFFP